MRKKRGFKLLLGVIVLLLVAGIGLYVYFHYFTLHPALESQLRDQFGDAFFDDFNDLDQNEPQTTDPDLIVERYEHRFASLEERANERLEELFEKAIADYRRQKEEGTLERFEFVNKYIQAGRLLEKQVDSIFYTLLDQMETELKKEELPTDVIEKAKEKYEEAKKEKNRALFERMREKLD